MGTSISLAMAMDNAICLASALVEEGSLDLLDLLEGEGERERERSYFSDWKDGRWRCIVVIEFGGGNEVRS